MRYYYSIIFSERHEITNFIIVMVTNNGKKKDRMI